MLYLCCLVHRRLPFSCLLSVACCVQSVVCCLASCRFLSVARCVACCLFYVGLLCDVAVVVGCCWLVSVDVG